MTSEHPTALDLHSLERTWDVVVVGAGPAGAAAACRAALLGLSTLLVERALFPRDKVCGGCLAPAGMLALDRLGLAGEIAGLGVPIRAIDFHARGRSATIGLALGGVAIGREALDAALARAAAAAGACVCHGISARLLTSNSQGATLALTGPKATREIRTRIVLVADGLGGSFLPRASPWSPRVRRGSRIGLGARIPARAAAHGIFPEPGVVAMHIATGGYVGLARLADRTIDIAAAVDPKLLQSAGSPGAALRAIMLESGCVHPPFDAQMRFRGTPPLTRRRILERGPVFVAGDAAQYVEPLSGEGMSWALRGGVAAADHASAWLAGRAHEGDWTRECARMFRASRWRCAALSLSARSPRLASGAALALTMLPSLAPLLRGMSARAWNIRTPAQGVA